MRNDPSIAEAVRHSDVVFNLVGRSYETKNYSYNDVHVEGARRIAHIAYEEGASRFIHLSHLNAAHDSKSYFYRSKAEGEDAVREAFPDATVVRPGPLYGHEDKFLNSIATKPAFWRVNEQATKVKPAHVLDVAEACKLSAYANSMVGQTLSLPGPKTYTYEQLIALAELNTLQKLQGMNIPLPLLKLASAAWENIWWPTSCPDDFTRKTIDDLPSQPGTMSWADLDMTPGTLEDNAILYLRRYRPAATFDAPPYVSGHWSLLPSARLTLVTVPTEVSGCERSPTTSCRRVDEFLTCRFAIQLAVRCDDCALVSGHARHWTHH